MAHDLDAQVVGPQQQHKRPAAAARAGACEPFSVCRAAACWGPAAAPALAYQAISPVLGLFLNRLVHMRAVVRVEAAPATMSATTYSI